MWFTCCTNGWFSGGWVIRRNLWIESLLEPAVFLFMLCVNQEVVAPHSPTPHICSLCPPYTMSWSVFKRSISFWCVCLEGTAYMCNQGLMLEEVYISTFTHLLVVKQVTFKWQTFFIQVSVCLRLWNKSTKHPRHSNCVYKS